MLPSSLSSSFDLRRLAFPSARFRLFTHYRTERGYRLLSDVFIFAFFPAWGFYWRDKNFHSFPSWRGPLLSFWALMPGTHNRLVSVKISFYFKSFSLLSVAFKDENLLFLFSTFVILSYIITNLYNESIT